MEESQLPIQQQTPEIEKAKSGLIIFLVEFLGIFIIISVILVVFNYFQILSLSRMFPVLSFLPQKNSLNINNPEVGQTVSRILTPKQQMESYAKQVLRPEYVPSNITNIKETFLTDQKSYLAQERVNGTSMMLGYFESIKGKTYDRSGISLDNDLSIIDATVVNVTEDIFVSTLNKYFKEIPVGEVDFKNIKPFALKDGSPVWEIVWNMKDGTKESRSMRMSLVNVPVSTQAAIITACKIYPENPQFVKSTCFNR